MIRLVLHGIALGCDTVDEAVAIVDRFAVPPLSPPIVGTVETTLPVSRTRTSVKNRKPTHAKPRKAGRKAKTLPPPAKTVPKGRAMTPEDDVIAALLGFGRPMRAAEIVDLTKRPAYTVKTTLAALVKARHVVKTGATHSLRYSLPPASAKPKPDAGLEPVWNGSKERAGVAPKLADMGRTA